ncbi:cytochrome d ubiquinol oxidase subunit II [Nitrosomonas sp. ANs5]|uniref:cytochrome d ubiquinol oxidase subunit II n=1 Tax=Nitrosomonas sp. ANs5 TaxID=3423941 RepID=UPI003D3340E6
MEYWLPVIYLGIMGLALLVYVILDGYDLGVGLLLPSASETEKDTMIASIGPFWDANETWLVLGIGILLIAFPKAHGIILTALYIPVTLMLFGLILRGVAFDLRVKAGDARKGLWNKAFFIGSLLASLAQGWMLGTYITGLETTRLSLLFAALIAVTLPALYVLLGAAWLLMKTEGALFTKAVRWARLALLPMGLTLVLVSIATPLVSDAIAERWFTLPNAIGLLPIPLGCVLLFIGMAWILGRPELLANGYAWLLFAGLVALCILASLGLAFSLFPDIIIGQMDIWQAAASVDSLLFILVGIVITLPAIIGYSIFVYRVFHGKASDLRYE